MRLHYAGKYSGDPASLPTREHHPRAQQLKEAEDMTAFTRAANLGSVAILVAAAIPVALLGWSHALQGPGLLLGLILSFAALLPHELLHALCFTGDVYLYQHLAQGVLFVTGTDELSRDRFVFMSLLPNLVFGLVPYVLFLIFPTPAILALGVMGALCLSMGMGDYINVYNVLRQVPRSGRVYGSGFHSYWYVP